MFPIARSNLESYQREYNLLLTVLQKKRVLSHCSHLL